MYELGHGVARNYAEAFSWYRKAAERGLAEADEVFEDTFYSPPLQQVPLETHCCVEGVECVQFSLVS